MHGSLKNGMMHERNLPVSNSDFQVNVNRASHPNWPFHSANLNSNSRQNDLCRNLSSEMRMCAPSQCCSSPFISDELIIMRSVQCIEAAWLSYRNKRIFRLLKHAVRAAESALPLEILRRICCAEAELLRDPCMKVNIRFRFGGSAFPPLIFFKIFLCNSNGQGVKYMSGKKIIRPSSEAARNAFQQMGSRKFYDQILVDNLQHQTHKVTDEVDVATLKDYMKYASIVDELPASLGGKDNSWRCLSLEALPRHTVFYDIVDFIQNRKFSPNLLKELPVLLTLPTTSEIQLKHIEILTALRTPTPDRLYKPKVPVESSQSSGRRSKQARLRLLQMRSAYLEDGKKQNDEIGIESTRVTRRESGDGRSRAVASELDALDEEAEELYEWTQGLSVEPFSTPRYSNSLMSGH